MSGLLKVIRGFYIQFASGIIDEIIISEYLIITKNSKEEINYYTELLSIISSTRQ